MAKLYVIAKAILQIGNLVKMAWEYYQDRQIRKVERASNERTEAVTRLNSKIEAESKKESPDEEAIKDLHRRLNNITKQL